MCMYRYNVGCTKRIGLFRPEKTKQANRWRRRSQGRPSIEAKKRVSETLWLALCFLNVKQFFGQFQTISKCLNQSWHSTVKIHKGWTIKAHPTLHPLVTLWLEGLCFGVWFCRCRLGDFPDPSSDFGGNLAYKWPAYSFFWDAHFYWLIFLFDLRPKICDISARVWQQTFFTTSWQFDRSSWLQTVPFKLFVAAASASFIKRKTAQHCVPKAVSYPCLTNSPLV